MKLKEQAKTFMTQIQARRRNPVSVATVQAYQSRLDKWILPSLGERDLAEIQNGVIKAFVQKLSENSLSASTVNVIFNILKQIVESAVDGDGKRLYERTWDVEFLDVPIVSPAAQKAPCVAAGAIQTIIKRASNRDKALCALLAGTGLRIGEAQALFVGPEHPADSTWNPETATIYVKSTVIGDTEIQNHPKTAAGIREIDLSPELNAFLRANLAPVVGGRMFASPDGGIMCRKAAVLRLPTVPGFHSLRRFRVTHLRKTAPEGLIKFWIGHQDASVTDRYDRIRVDVQARKECAARAGLGFSL